MLTLTIARRRHLPQPGDIEAAADVACPGCGGDMRPLQLACHVCIADGRLGRKRTQAAARAERNTRYVEAVLGS